MVSSGTVTSATKDAALQATVVTVTVGAPSWVAVAVTVAVLAATVDVAVLSPVAVAAGVGVSVAPEGRLQAKINTKSMGMATGRVRFMAFSLLGRKFTGLTR